MTFIFCNFEYYFSQWLKCNNSLEKFVIKITATCLFHYIVLNRVRIFSTVSNIDAFAVTVSSLQLNMFYPVFNCTA